MTGLALTAAGVAVPSAANAVAHTPTSIGPDRPNRSFTDDDRGEHDDGKHDDTDRTKNDKGKTKKARKPKAIPVPCNTDKLIAAITLANARGGAVLDLAKDCTYLLTANIDGAGLPAVTTPITLNGGDKNTTIKRAPGAEQFRILTVDIGGYLTLNHLTITGGQTTGDGGGILVNAGAAATIGHSKILNNISSQNGGGISSSGTTHLKNSTVKGNISSSRGGGIENTGTLTLRQSNIKTNSASVAGGVQHGIPGGIPTSGTLTIISSNVAGNQAQRHGGMLISTGTGMIKDSKVVRNISLTGSGIASAAQLTLLDSHVVDNVATGGVGGGMLLAANSATSIRNSILEGNVSLTGGGIYNEGELTVAWTKIVDNQTTTLGGGGIYNRSTGMVNLFATKVIKNIAATDGGGIFNEAGGTVDLNTATGTIIVKNRPNNCFNVPGCFG